MKHLDSPCGRYRYLVTTKVAKEGEPVGFILGHPSDGPPEQDTAVKRCMYLAKREGYGGAIIVYANALKHPYVADAKSVAEVIGEKTNACIARMAKMCKVSVAAYGEAVGADGGGRVFGILRRQEGHTQLCLPFGPRKHPGSIMSVAKDTELWPHPPVFLYHAESDSPLVVSQEAWANGEFSEGTSACEPIYYEKYMDLKAGVHHAENT